MIIHLQTLHSNPQQSRDNLHPIHSNPQQSRTICICKPTEKKGGYEGTEGWRIFNILPFPRSPIMALIDWTLILYTISLHLRGIFVGFDKF